MQIHTALPAEPISWAIRSGPREQLTFSFLLLHIRHRASVRRKFHAVSQHAQLEAHLIVPEAVAAKPRSVDGALALLDVLFGPCHDRCRTS